MSEQKNDFSEEIFSEKKEKRVKRIILYPEKDYLLFYKICSKVAKKPLNFVLVKLIQQFNEENKHKLKK